MDPSDHRCTSRDFLTEFIKTYQAHPALWKIRSKAYRNKHLKNIGYDALIKLYKKFDPNANRDVVSRKINLLRACYRRDLRKLMKFEHLGEGQVYKPALWYFDLFHFIRAQEQENCIEDHFKRCITKLEEDEFGEENIYGNSDIYAYSDCSTPSGSVIRNDYTNDLPMSYQEFVNVTGEGYQESNNRYDNFGHLTPLQKDSVLIQSKYNSSTDTLRPSERTIINEGDAFCQYVSAKYEKIIDPEQKMFAELLISEILNKAGLRRLCDNTQIVDKS